MKLEFKHRPDREYQWEAYRSPQDYGGNKVWEWLWETFGPIGGQWESHGGWIKLKGDAEMMLFKLKWA